MKAPHNLTQFRIETQPTGLAHLVFDCPDRTMNVFSDAAILELGRIAEWLAETDVRGLVIRSGKENAFCAGADLTELGVAYDMIVAAPPARRFNLAYAHFFRLSSALRALETSGKPVASAIGGLALGGGCELALATHHRVLVDDQRVAMGLPEALVGLLPGAGGTQRLPRLVGVQAALPILLDGARLSGRAALDAGLVDELVAPGDEVKAAEDWVLSAAGGIQPWDRPDWRALSSRSIAEALQPVRDRVLGDTQGHYPAPLAILDCIEFGLPQRFEGAIRTEMAIFADLIQRPEPRNMIQTMFLAKTDYERLKRKSQLPDFIEDVVAAARAQIAAQDHDALADAGFPGSGRRTVRPTRGYWVEQEAGRRSRAALEAISSAVASLGAALSPEQRRLADYAVVAATGYPAYLGGPFAFADRTD